MLVVEDQKALANRIAEGLRDQGMAVDVAYDGAAAIEATVLNRYDVVVLDRDLPRVHGDAVCAGLVAWPIPARILMLTAAAAVEDRVDGLNLGADDYLPKPFAFTELVARVRALSRRSPSTPPVLDPGRPDRGPGPPPGQPGRPAADADPEGVRRAGSGLGADGAVVSAEELLENVWDEHADPFSNTVSVTMTRLRRKLGEPPLIETVIGSGYRLRVP